MSKELKADRDQQVLCYLSRLPQKMLCFHGNENVAEFVLYDLCNEQCLNLNKAAYFVDNPDFDCFKGVAGYCRDESAAIKDPAWNCPDVFLDHMKRSPFNQKVRSIVKSSTRRSKSSDDRIVQAISEDLGLKNPAFCSWDMKHDNHGLFVYESQDIQELPSKECVLSGACLLSFCPII